MDSSFWSVSQSHIYFFLQKVSTFNQKKKKKEKLHLTSDLDTEILDSVNEETLLFIFINLFCLVTSKIITNYPEAKFN